MIIPKILVFPGSTRAASINGRLAAVIAKELSLLDADVTRISLDDYSLPIYNGDFEVEHGVPQNVFKLARIFAAHQGIVIVTPEYNSSMPPLLKNTLDWLSRISKDKGRPLTPYRGNIFALAASSGGGLGGIRVLPHLRDVLVSVGAQVISEQLALGNASSAYDDMDNLVAERPQELLRSLCLSLIDKAKWYCQDA